MPALYPVELVEAVTEGIDAGIYYQRHLDDYVFDRMGGPGFVPAFIEEVEINKPLVDKAQENQIRRDIEERLTTADRGVMAAMKIVWPGEDGPQIVRHYFVAVGFGRKPYYTSRNADAPPLLDEIEGVARSMVAYEVYCVRQAIEFERQAERDVAALNRLGMTVGTKYVAPQGHPMSIGGKKWSSATVTAADAASGQVTLELTRRGSANKFRTTIGASRLAALAGLPCEPNVDPDETLSCIVTTAAGASYRFDRLPGTGFVMTCLDTGTTERIETFDNAVWMLRDDADGSCAVGPDSLQRAWRLAVTRVFPNHTVRQPDLDICGPRI